MTFFSETVVIPFVSNTLNRHEGIKLTAPLVLRVNGTFLNKTVNQMYLWSKNTIQTEIMLIYDLIVQAADDETKYRAANLQRVLNVQRLQFAGWSCWSGAGGGSGWTSRRLDSALCLGRPRREGIKGSFKERQRLARGPAWSHSSPLELCQIRSGPR